VRRISRGIGASQPGECCPQVLERSNIAQIMEQEYGVTGKRSCWMARPSHGNAVRREDVSTTGNGSSQPWECCLQVRGHASQAMKRPNDESLVRRQKKFMIHWAPQP